MAVVPDGYIPVSKARNNGGKSISRQAIHQRIRKWGLPHILIGNTTYLEETAFFESIEEGKRTTGRKKKKSEAE